MSITSTSDQILARSLGVYDQSVSDKEVAARILQNIQGIYSWVAVQTISYQFQGVSGPRKTREITVRPSNWDGLCHLIACLWRQSNLPIGVNCNQAVSAILGSKNPQDIAHLKAAADRQYKITLRFDMESEQFNFEIAEIGWWCAVM